MPRKPSLLSFVSTCLRNPLCLSITRNLPVVCRASSSGFNVWFSASGLNVLCDVTYVFFSSFAHPTLSTILNTGRSILEGVINGSFLFRILASRGVGAGLDEGRRSRYSNWTLGDEAVYIEPLHEILFNSGSANLEGSDWLELHMSPYPLKSLCVGCTLCVQPEMSCLPV